LVEAAARIIATEGAGGLTLRRVADEVGTSTMAIYTHFGGMAELRRAVRREGFARLAAYLADIDATNDPVADLAMIGLAYHVNATANPDLYRVMFMEQALDAAEGATGAETFDTLVAGVQRCIDAGRFEPSDAADLALQLWAVGHGLVTLQLAGILSFRQALQCLGETAENLFTSYGDDRGAAGRSLVHAVQRARLERRFPSADAS
jgi:AcrR family transcriptional regulator